MNIRSNNIRIAFNPHESASEKKRALDALRNELGNEDKETIREILLPQFSEMFDIPIVRSTSPSNYGTRCLDTSHERYEAAKKGMYRLVRKIQE